MAERRMFAKTIIDSDSFLDMPLSAQALYFHLSMRADDDGFINNPRKIQRMISATDDDMKLLIAKQFVIPFDSGIVVIKHWKIHNYIRSDRYKPTIYQDEKAQIQVDNDSMYTIGIPSGSRVVSQMDTQARLGKVSIGKDNTPPTPSKGANDKKEQEQRFCKFWEAYPKKTAKQNAYKAWQKLSPDDELTVRILIALEQHKKSAQWQRDNGQYIPYPATWLNGKRWEDETTDTKSAIPDYTAGVTEGVDYL